MARINSLTPEQIAKFPAYVQEWTGYGVCTDPADRIRAEAAIAAMYEIAGKKPPRIVWCDSPLSMALTRAVVQKLPASVRDSVWDSVRASVGASVYGQHDASWLAFYRFFRDECGMTGETEKLRGLWELCQSCGWILPFENVCFASERHDVCKLDGRGVIHCEDGPAIHYRDGFSVHAWHGTRVPPNWIEGRANLKASEVMAERNVEVRRAGIEILGWKAIIDQLGGKVIEADADPEIGTVIELSLPDLPRPARFLRVRCATGRDFALGLPPDLPTADGYSLPHCAQAWAAQLHPAEWRKPLQTA